MKQLIILFSFLSSTVFAQEDFKTLLIKKTVISENFIKQHLLENGMDTTEYYYIPVFNSLVYIENIKILSRSSDSSLNGSSLREILIVEKKNNCIIGSYRICENPKGYMHFVSKKYINLSGMPCDMASKYSSIKNYDKIKIKKEKIIFLFQIFNDSILGYCSDTGKIQIIR